MSAERKDEYEEIYSNLDSNDEGFEENSEASRDWLGFDVPSCPECGSKMRYHFEKRIFKCFSCGYEIDEDDLEDVLDDHASFDDIYSGDKTPTCEECGCVMNYSRERCKFRCPRCGSTLDESDWELATEFDDYEEFYGCQDDDSEDD